MSQVARIDICRTRSFKIKSTKSRNASTYIRFLHHVQQTYQANMSNFLVCLWWKDKGELRNAIWKCHLFNFDFRDVVHLIFVKVIHHYLLHAELTYNLNQRPAPDRNQNW